MCLIVHKMNKDSEFTNEQFYNMVSANSDGLGIMFRDGGRIHVEKVLGNSKKQFAVFQKHRDREEYAMHARFKTHGRIDEANCHPYEILNIDKGDPIDMYLMHNGVINVKDDADASMSDTWNFVEGVMKPIAKLDHNLFWENENVQDIIRKAIGTSKFLIMRSDETPVLIINRDAGDDVNGCWLSNLHSTRMIKRESWIGGVKTVTYEQSSNVVSRRTVTPPYNHGNSVTVTKKDDKKEPVLNVYRDTHRRNTWWKAASSNPLALFPRNDTTEHKTAAERVKERRAARAADRERNMTNEEWEQMWIEHQAASNKVVELHPHKVEEKFHDMQAYLNILKGMKDEDMIESIEGDAEYVAAMIESFYEKNTMSRELLIEHCNDAEKVLDIVKLIRHLPSKAA